MSKLFELLKQHCPDGVKFCRLEEVTSIKRGKRVTKNELSPEGAYPVYSGGVTPMGYYEKFNQPANTLTVVKYGTAGFVNFIEEEFWANDVCYCVKPKDVLDTKYLFYVLKDKQDFIQSQATDAIPAHLPTDVIGSVQVPIPPLLVQKEIVSILDKFAELEKELKKELEDRLKQYEYYRVKLLNFEGITHTTLSEVVTYSTSRIGSDKLDRENYVGVDNLLQNRKGKTDSGYVPQSGNMTRYEEGDVLLGNIRPYLKKIWYADRVGGTNGDVLVMHIKDEYKDKLIPRYLYQQLASEKFFDFNVKKSKGAKMPRGDKASIMKFEIQVPSVEEQKRVVSILDKFDRLTYSTEEGLPAELNARHHQYEYYRRKLLTFQELPA